METKKILNIMRLMKIKGRNINIFRKINCIISSIFLKNILPKTYIHLKFELLFVLVPVSLI